jgi:HD-GYP domain-containing protein (c-di-GMP phosphodiesterase class II)
MDGSGYPDGLKGDQIPPATQVIIVADAYDAMSSDRAYRPALSPEKIIEQLRRFSGSQFSPDVADTFVEMIQQGEVPQHTGA